MKRFLKVSVLPILVIAAISGAVTPAIAQAVPDAKIAVVDQRRLFSESLVSQDIRKQLTTISTGFGTEENKSKDTLLKEKEDLDKQRGIIAPEAFEQKYNDLKGRADQLNRKMDLHQKQLNVAQVRANRELQTVLMPIINQVATQRGATVVLEKSQVVYNVESLDVTAPVIELLNKQLPSLKVQLPTEAEILEMERQAAANGQGQ